MRFLAPLVVLTLIHAADPSSAVVKVYNSSSENGLPGDAFQSATNLCPPVLTTEATLGGFARLEDDGAGSVSLEVSTQVAGTIDLGPDLLTVTFGPGAFLFIEGRESRTNVPPGGSAHPGLGGSGSDPGEAAVWGIVSGWASTGFRFCLSSPVQICNQNDFAHGATILAATESGTYNLGTWAFDGEGDYEATTPYITRTSNGGLSNNQSLLRGAFQGSALPALPLVGFGALSLSLAVIGARSLMGRK